ncbi:hypothetical protein BD289DRAFT_61896 [Coniella lustricola]|uniref:FAD-binding FR-type domain-containing protein n=1 Tax=Coniella lustricola TaxID=2025994 RepID=A0A2T3A0L6_9PEZI|nr:hypothetical protein BD289DRAFT_61896 [Coniella lustricola]
MNTLRGFIITTKSSSSSRESVRPLKCLDSVDFNSRSGIVTIGGDRRSAAVSLPPPLSSSLWSVSSYSKAASTRTRTSIYTHDIARRHKRMASMKLDHAERTATEPRNGALHRTVLAQVDEINPTTRIIRLGIPKATGTIRFLPGQWLDVFVPDIPDRPGGFTITSPPFKAVHRTPITAPSPQQTSSQLHSTLQPQSERLKTSHAPSPATTPSTTTTPPTDVVDDKSKLPYLELAIRKAPENKVAVWLWQPIDKILDAEVSVRVGGRFVWPAPGLVPTTLRKIVLVAGGVGINPLISIASHILSTSTSSNGPASRLTVEILYSMRDPGEGNRVASKMLFVERLADMFGALAPTFDHDANDNTNRDGVETKAHVDSTMKPTLKGHLKVFITSGTTEAKQEAGDGNDHGNSGIGGTALSFTPRRITIDDISQAIGPDKRFCAVYVCGVPTMTDEFVEKLTSPTGLGLERHRVLSEKWW